MLNTVVIGAGGYSGRELVSCLLSHPGARIAGVFASSSRGEGAPERFDSVHPRFRGRIDLPLLPVDMAAVLALKPDAVFLATPHEASYEMAPALLEKGVVVIDISAAFRLKDASLYKKHYGFAHNRADLLEKAVYGLPELFRTPLKKADLVAAAGCYPTSAILPLAPLLRAGAVDRGRAPIVDSTSGVSGAGRSPAVKSLFCEVSLQPYGVFAHRHNPEIDLYAGAHVVFTPHLGAFDRGILSTIHVELAPGWTGARAREELTKAYKSEPFVRLLPAGEWPSVASVRETNFCDIALASDDEGKHLILVSAIDNLTKGAAGQAIQCMNIRFVQPETAGLLP